MVGIVKVDTVALAVRWTAVVMLGMNWLDAVILEEGYVATVRLEIVEVGIVKQAEVVRMEMVVKDATV